MYTIVQALGVPFGLNKRWQIIDLTQYTVAQLYINFRIVQIQLLPVGVTTPVFLLLSSIVNQYGTFQQPFQSLLTAIGNNTLPTTDTGLVINQQRALFVDAYRSGFKIVPVDENNSIPVDVDTYLLPNVRITRDDITINYTDLQTGCLVNINGFYHTSTTDGVNGVVVNDAMNSLIKSNQNQVALYNFSNMGNLTQIPITVSMINNTLPTSPVINLPIDVSNNTVFLVLGGYFMQIDGTVLQQVSNSSFQINFNLIDLVNRYYESINYLVLDSILEDTPPNNPNQIVISDLTTPSAINSWLTLSQSFFVVLDCAEVYTQKQYIKRIGIPNQYISYTRPDFPLVLELGRQPPYWLLEECNNYLLSIYNNPIGDLLYETTNPIGITTSGVDQPGSPGKLQEAYLLEIGTDLAPLN